MLVRTLLVQFRRASWTLCCSLLEAEVGRASGTRAAVLQASNDSAPRGLADHYPLDPKSSASASMDIGVADNIGNDWATLSRLCPNFVQRDAAVNLAPPQGSAPSPVAVKLAL